jgi:competence protein ComEC
LITPLALLFAAVPWPPLLHLDHLLLSFLMAFLEWLANWPFWQQAAPPLAATLLALVGVVFLLLPRGFPARWFALCLLFPSLFLPASRPTSGSAWIDVLDVGQGLAVLIRTAGHNLLYDTGPLYSAESDAGQRIIVPYLHAIGIERIDTLIVTHRDSDHSGGVAVNQSATGSFPGLWVMSGHHRQGHDRLLLASQGGTSWYVLRLTDWNPLGIGLLQS